MIPVPRVISAGCGLAWKAAPEDRETLVAALDKAGLTFAGVYIVNL